MSVGGGREPVWTASGELFYRNLTGRVIMVSVTTQPELTIGAPRQLFQGPYYLIPGGPARPQYDATRDGTRLLMLAADLSATSTARPRIVVVQNWTEELRRLVPVN
ncbi:MAG: hypothetical protein HY657_03175 [Acidobacteria bacterium]|nr:hypothetical protein [Acidobacteriota bacterium]